MKDERQEKVNNHLKEFKLSSQKMWEIQKPAERVAEVAKNAQEVERSLVIAEQDNSTFLKRPTY
jgi:hypothetical protein